MSVCALVIGWAAAASSIASGLTVLWSEPPHPAALTTAASRIARIIRLRMRAQRSGAGESMSHPNVDTAETLALPGLSAERRAAARDAWAAFWSSRAIVWGAGMAAVLIRQGLWLFGTLLAICSSLFVVWALAP